MRIGSHLAIVVAIVTMCGGAPAWATGDTGSHLDSEGNVVFDVQGNPSIRFAPQPPTSGADTTCAAQSKGAIRYNDAQGTFQGCDGKGVWHVLGQRNLVLGWPDWITCRGNADGVLRTYQLMSVDVVNCPGTTCVVYTHGGLAYHNFYSASTRRIVMQWAQPPNSFSSVGGTPIPSNCDGRTVEQMRALGQTGDY